MVMVKVKVKEMVLCVLYYYRSEGSVVPPSSVLCLLFALCSLLFALCSLLFVVQVALAVNCNKYNLYNNLVQQPCVYNNLVYNNLVQQPSHGIGTVLFHGIVSFCCPLEGVCVCVCVCVCVHYVCVHSASSIFWDIWDIFWDIIFWDIIFWNIRRQTVQ
jgi:hypothetical protein